MRVGLILVFVVSAFAAASCSQGVGDRCVQNSDCSSGICSVTSVNGGTCLAPTSTTPGTGGTSAVGGQSGQGGEAGQGGGAGGQGGLPADGGQDAATDADAG